MNFKIRSLISTSLLLAAMGSAHAFTYGLGGADDQLDIVSTGADITYFPEIGGFDEAINSGAGTASFSRTTNDSDYFNVNSISEVVNGAGNSYEEAPEGVVYFFTNNSSQDETVTVQWQGFATSTAYTDTSRGYSWDFAEAYLQIQNSFYAADFLSESYGTVTGSDFEQDTVTFTVPANTPNFVISSDAYNESVSVQTAPSPAAIMPFAFGLVAAVRRRVRR
jgi:hypothetical protein